MSKLVVVDNELRDASTQEDHPGMKHVNKYIYLFFALFLGDFGIHRFYAGKPKSGILYLVFCWTFVPWFLSFYDFIKGCGKLKDAEDRIWV